MASLPIVAPKTFYDIVVQVAIIRPGPIVGNLYSPYARRRQGLEPARPRAGHVHGQVLLEPGVPSLEGRHQATAHRGELSGQLERPGGARAACRIDEGQLHRGRDV